MPRKRNLSEVSFSSASDSEYGVDTSEKDSESEGEPDEIDKVSDVQSESDNTDDEDESDDGICYSLGDPFKSKDGTVWFPYPTDTGKIRAADKMSGRQGVRRHVKSQVKTFVDSFNVFFNSEIKAVVLIHTNAEGSRVMKDSWTVMDSVELDAFFGLLLLQKVYYESRRPVADLWSITKGRPLNKAVMSRNRFKEILRALRFDDKPSRRLRLIEDKMAHISELWNLWVPTLKNSYLPGPFVTGNEQLYPFRGRCRFKQYIPSKPAKCGIKTWILADAETNYCWNIQVYTGKPEGGRPEQNQGRRVILDLTRDLGVDSGRNITCDNFFTDITLASELLQRNMTLVGTVRKNKKEIPDAFRPGKDREVYSSLFGFQKDFTLVSYVPKKGKAVILLSSFHHDMCVDDGIEQKPEIIKTYNKTKAGVDTLDQLVAKYSVKRRNNRWPVILFFNMIDISASNALIIWTDIFPDWNKKRHRRRVFLADLGEDLIRKHLSRRMLEKSTSAELKRIIRVQLGVQVSTPACGEPQASGASRIQQRCKQCGRKRDRKTYNTCDDCGIPVCNDHVKVKRSCISCCDVKEPG